MAANPTWNNVTRGGTSGVRSTVTVNPDTIKRDVDEDVRSMQREQFPIIEFSKIVGKGKPAINKKVEVMNHEAFDHWDEITATTIGTSGNSEQRFMNITVAQRSRPQVNGNMFYTPQDTFHIAATGQKVICVMTPDYAYKVNGVEKTFSTALTGSGNTARSAVGTIVVMNVEPDPIINFTTSEFLYTGRTIWESQDYEAKSSQEDVFFDYNFVETKDCLITVTSDQLDFYNAYGTIGNFTWQQEQKLKNFKKECYYNLWFGKRAMEITEKDSPIYHLRGLIDSIKTNVTVYDPRYVNDFERLVSNWMMDKAFRYNPNDVKKVVYCGSNFAKNFNLAFREFRRSELSDQSPSPGLNIRTYDFLDFSIKMMIDGTFATDTKYTDWAVCVDPLESLLCINKEFVQHDPTLSNSRKKTIAWTWQGTIRHHREKSSAILRTA